MKEFIFLFDLNILRDFTLVEIRANIVNIVNRNILIINSSRTENNLSKSLQAKYLIKKVD
jgi:hypothetical protein